MYIYKVLSWPQDLSGSKLDQEMATRQLCSFAGGKQKLRSVGEGARYLECTARTCTCAESSAGGLKRGKNLRKLRISKIENGTN
jgi:hypothetical protein